MSAKIGHFTSYKIKLSTEIAKVSKLETSLRIKSTPWDEIVFGIKTYELNECDEKTFKQISTVSGHYTIKVDPLSCKELLHKNNFYYCDTLLQPYANKNKFIPHFSEKVTLNSTESLTDLLRLSDGVFSHGRFHRDFNIKKSQADQRYNNWLSQLHDKGETFGIYWDNQLAAFFACQGSHIALHAVAEEFQGKGLAKYLWSHACDRLFSQGYPELTSSVSAANTAVVNLYASLGFKFRTPVDIYHRLVE